MFVYPSPWPSPRAALRGEGMTARKRAVDSLSSTTCVEERAGERRSVQAVGKHSTSNIQRGPRANALALSVECFRFQPVRRPLSPRAPPNPPHSFVVEREWPRGERAVDSLSSTTCVEERAGE